MKHTFGCCSQCRSFSPMTFQWCWCIKVAEFTNSFCRKHQKIHFILRTPMIGSSTNTCNLFSSLFDSLWCLVAACEKKNKFTKRIVHATWTSVEPLVVFVFFRQSSTHTIFKFSLALYLLPKKKKKYVLK